MHPMRVKRFFRRLSLDELGARTGIDQGKLSRIERGYLRAKGHEMKSIAKVLNCHVSELFPSEDTTENGTEKNKL